MPISRIVRILVLVAAVTGLGILVYAQGFGWRLGGSPAPIRATYQTESAWIVDDVVRDVTEMSAYVADRATVPQLDIHLLSPDVYKVSIKSPRSLSFDLNVRNGLWAPASYVGIATAVLDATRSDGPTPAARGEFGTQYEALLDNSPAQLVHVAMAVSDALARDMRDAHGHESAALILGVFGLREASGRFHDARWALNRMTAHLAMAVALARSAPPSVDGQLADVVLLTLTNQQVRALESLDRLESMVPSAAMHAWARALRFRVTQDWRLVPDPVAAPMFEKIEYFRARRSTVSGTRAALDLDAIGVEMNTADWTRILQTGFHGVEEGHMVANEALRLELEEAATVFHRLQGQSHAPTIDDLNARATRTISSGPSGA